MDQPSIPDYAETQVRVQVSDGGEWETVALFEFDGAYRTVDLDAGMLRFVNVREAK